MPTTTSIRLQSQQEVGFDKIVQRIPIETGESRRNSDQSDLIEDHLYKNGVFSSVEHHERKPKTLFSSLVDILTNEASERKNSSDTHPQTEKTSNKAETAKLFAKAEKQQLIHSFPKSFEVSDTINTWLNQIIR